MTSWSRIMQWVLSCTMIVAVGLTAVGCSKVPRHYVRMAEPEVTLTDLVAHPEKYRGKVVLLGGALIEEEANEQYLWLRVNNRPLDQDYMPHRPADMIGPEAGSYWVLVSKDKLPKNYHKWARMTVAGRVTGTIRFKTEPVLALLYVRGWGISGDHDGVWDSLTDRNYSPSLPTDIGGEFGSGVR